jgi:hypothetical protein
MKCGYVFLLIWSFAASSLAIAVPKGAVKLPSSDTFQSGNIICGKIKGSWIPGRNLAGGFFYSRAAERKNTLTKAKTSSGAKKTKLLKKAKQLKSKQKSESPTCLTGPTPTATPTINVTLNTINESLYNTEHSIFIIPTPGQVTWTGSASWDSVYSTANIDSYVNTLKSAFPNDYFFITITAKDLQPNRVPNVLTYRSIASGIGQDSLTNPTLSNICRYNTEGPVSDSVYAVLDHEIGHNWGVFIGSELGTGHWLPNANSEGLMADIYSEDNFETIKRITGNPTSGFTWTSQSNASANEIDIFSDRDLYLQGLNSTFPTLHVLSSPVYNSNNTVSYSALNSYDQTWVETRNGVRSPNYRNSEKQFRIGFIYVARDFAEIQEVYQAIERSIRHFSYAETIDTNNYRFQTPFTVATKYRASVNSRLTNLDGNTAPSITIVGSNYASTTNGSASFSFTATDSGETPVVSCVPSSNICSISGNTILLSNLTSGANFFTVKAEDSQGKKAFAHVVVDVL